MARLSFYFLLVLLLFTMPTCPECDEEYTRFSSHALKCKALVGALNNAPAIKRKHREEVEDRQAKQRRLEEEQRAREVAERAEQERRQVRHYLVSGCCNN